MVNPPDSCMHSWGLPSTSLIYMHSDWRVPLLPNSAKQAWRISPYWNSWALRLDQHTWSAGFIWQKSRRIFENLHRSQYQAHCWTFLERTAVYEYLLIDYTGYSSSTVPRHFISWVTQACGPLKINAWCRWLPPNHNIRTSRKELHPCPV